MKKGIHPNYKTATVKCACGNEFETGSVKEEIKVEHMERYSNRTNGKMDFSGLLGTIEYEGGLTPFVPWLYAAQRLHVGRNTTFGMGKIEVYFI